MKCDWKIVQLFEIMCDMRIIQQYTYLWEELVGKVLNANAINSDINYVIGLRFIS